VINNNCIFVILTWFGFLTSFGMFLVAIEEICFTNVCNHSKLYESYCLSISNLTFLFTKLGKVNLKILQSEQDYYSLVRIDNKPLKVVLVSKTGIRNSSAPGLRFLKIDLDSRIAKHTLQFISFSFYHVAVSRRIGFLQN
jgi:hypothetical protein